jgi:cyclopropane fatty-acyl-phospholipid synthase-like methyltransferase
MDKNQQTNELFFELYSNLPQQAPGSKKCTQEAYGMLPLAFDSPKILDIGCGTGRQSLDLAEVSNGKINAVDIYPPFIDELNKTIHLKGLKNKLKAQVADMNSLDFEPNSFDVVWSEGAIYQMGFENGLTNWKNFLKPKGFMVISEICWIKTKVPQEIMDYWLAQYPGITYIKDLVDKSEKLGFNVLSHFTLPEKDWNRNYYLHLSKNLEAFKLKYAENEVAMKIAHETETEITMYKKYCDYYSYLFLILQIK